MLYPLSINSPYISLSTNEYPQNIRRSQTTDTPDGVCTLQCCWWKLTKTIESRISHLKELVYIRCCQVASSPVCSTIILLSGPDSTLLKDVIARIFIYITARTDATLRRAADTNFGDYGGTFCIIL